MSADSLVPVDRGVFYNSSPAPPGVPGAPGVVPTYPERCKAIDSNYDLIPALVCAMYLVFGVVYTLFGKHVYENKVSITKIYKKYK